MNSSNTDAGDRFVLGRDTTIASPPLGAPEEVLLEGQYRAANRSRSAPQFGARVCGMAGASLVRLTRTSVP